MAVLLDDFNRANGALGSAWTADAFGGEAGIPIVGNAAFCSTPPTEQGSWWNATTYASTVAFEIVVTGTPAGNTAMFVWTQLDVPHSVGASNNGYVWNLLFGGQPAGQFTFQLYRMNGGGFTLVGSQAGLTLASGDTVRFERSGANFLLKKNGTQIASIADGSPLSNAGYFAIGSSQSAVGFDSVWVDTGVTLGAAALSGVGGLTAAGVGDGLRAVPITPKVLAVATNVATAKEGLWPPFIPGADAYPGMIWGAGVLDAAPIVLSDGLFPPFVPGTDAYPGRGSTLAASPIT